MQVHEIPVGELNEIIVRPDGEDTFSIHLSEKAEAQLYYSQDLDEIILSVENQRWSIISDLKEQQSILWEVATQRTPRLSWIVERQPKDGSTQKILLGIRQFSHHHKLASDENFEFPVRESHFDILRKTIIRNPHLHDEQAIQWLFDHVIVNTQGKQFLLISAGGDNFEGQRARAFRILGQQVALDVEQRDGVYEITRLVSFRGVRNTLPVILVEGKFNFVDASVVAKFKQTSITELDRIVSTVGSYLGIWHEYNRLERKILIEKARQFGWVHYDLEKVLPDGWRLKVKLSDAPKLERIHILEDMDFEVSSNLPKELQEEFDLDDEEEEENSPFKRETPGMAVQCADVNQDTGYIDIRPVNPEESEPPPSKGFFYPSISGDRVRLKRRQYAWQTIRDDKNPIPMLGLLIEGSGQFVSRHYPSKAIDPKKLRDAFQDKPTPRQAKAIEISINTPDIALIQGPPGTGKTRVITALNRILSGEHILSGGVAGQILLTSYQHDAVENAASRTTVFGLPAIKIGRKRFNDVLVDQTEIWAERMANELRQDPARSNQPPAILASGRIHSQLLGYLRSPGTVEDTVRMLRDVHITSLHLVPTDLSERLLSLVRRLETSSSRSATRLEGEKEMILNSVRRLRTMPSSFSDDGPDSADALLKRAGKILREDEKELLQLAADWESSDTPDFLSQLANLQARLIENLTTPAVLDQANLVNADVEALLVEVDKCMLEVVQKNGHNPEATIEQFIVDLINDPEAVQDTLWHYTAVLAATCQQSVGSGMQNAKGIDQQPGASLQFETVIVDEAARSNPLDLLIPMSLAKRRIILVGDHRQLPHLLEMNVERGLEHSGDAAREALGRSLFERLFNYLQERERIDGITRTITLDQQYRMHPELGNFVSRTFYERHNPQEAFRSDARSVSEFSHHLDGYQGKIAAWIDVPSRLGIESRTQSKSRRIEARCIAQEVARILEQHHNFTVGVITFYASQVQEIFKEMAKYGLADETGGILQVDRRWLQGGTERLRVGTVDAFQGMEFDIVLLSVVRSNNLEAYEEDEISQRRKWGFLTLENRLCVAMSRQKRMLIVVGDQENIHHPAAPKAIPGLVSFYRELCREPYGIVHPFQP